MFFLLPFLFGLLPVAVKAQSEAYKWKAEEVSYKIPAASDPYLNGDSEAENENTSADALLMKGARTLYKFFISDLDGKNCPFHPSCSEFFVEAVQKSGLIKGVLMFSDRFTRDINLIKIHHYPLHKSGYLYDPVNNYTLNPSDIKYLPADEPADEN